jgi:hypothetical protein
MKNYRITAAIGVALFAMMADNASAITITTPGGLDRAVVEPVKQIWCSRPRCSWRAHPYYGDYYAAYSYGFFETHGHDGWHWHRHW